MDNGDMELQISHGLASSDAGMAPFRDTPVFAGRPALMLCGRTVYVVHDAPPASVVEYWSRASRLPVRVLSERLRVELRKCSKTAGHGDGGCGRERIHADGLPAAGGEGESGGDEACREVARDLEQWLLPAESGVTGPSAALQLRTFLRPSGEQPSLFELAVRFELAPCRGGRKTGSPARIAEVIRRAARDAEGMGSEDGRFLAWVGEQFSREELGGNVLRLDGLRLLRWLAHWGRRSRLSLNGAPLRFQGQVMSLTPHLEDRGQGLLFIHRLGLPSGETRPLSEARFLGGQPALVLVEHTFYLLRHPPPPLLIAYWAENPAVSVHHLSHRLRTHLRRTQAGRSVDWDQLCITHRARPRFIFELSKDKDIVELRLKAIAEDDGSEWHWTGQEWQPDRRRTPPGEKPEILEDPRLDAVVRWLRLLDWFTPEPGLWVGDASENFLNTLAMAWPSKPAEADYLGNPTFQRLFLAPRRLRPKLVVRGSGIDWLSVSAEWEQQGLKLTKADLERLRAATTRFVKLPDAGWVELDTSSVERAQETMADLGIDGLNPTPIRIGMEQAAALDEQAFRRFIDNPEIQALRKKLEHFEGIPEVRLPEGVQAELRPYQREGFSFLCHLTGIRLGGILADDMGLGKTLQTLTWIAWLSQRNRKQRKPVLVICPASVLHNWRREAERFTPQLKVLVLESGAARHRLRKQIPQNDIIVTNYALLRRDWEELEKFHFAAVILDEAQFIKNPGAQVTVSVKKLKATQRLALTGTPLENRLLDLWSITDFIQPGYLGTQDHFLQTYEPKAEGEDSLTVQRIARRRLSAKLRPLLMRRLKKQVAKDLPDRIEERRDCELGEEQRKLYLAELRRSRDQVLKAVAEKGLAKSKMHVLAALTRLRQICCHPTLVGNDAPSGKTETLFELLEPLLAEGQKVLLFSQFVQMLRILERECAARHLPTHILTGETKERHQVVQTFQDDPNAAVFLLSLRAAGTGLNLTTASYVVLYDPWWNPAVEAQAIDRSHRIGQTRTVNAYRLIAPGTVEEKIYDLQQRKAQTIADVLGEEGFARNLSQTDLEFLFAED
ncbi:MAG: DEAD/DEAH box helicase [Verrucomicrobia bacterium]|nr:DEAD/DEAH box helicase [Verrucomicrobiota bacterium]